MTPRFILTIIAAVIFMIFLAGYLAAAPPPGEYELASAYHCGMLDALQQKIGRGRACDVYKEIAKKKGVSVPP